MRLSQLTDSPYNPRKISSKSKAGLSFSLDEFGDISGIVFNRKTGNLVAAHQRKKSILESIDPEITMIGPDYGYFEYKGNRFNVRFVDWDLEKEKAANIAANSPTLAGEFDGGLNAILQDISIDLPDIFEKLNLSDIDTKLDIADVDNDADDDNIPEKADTKCKYGDMWRLGEHRLLCGSSAELESISAVIGDDEINLVITDPPYDLDKETLIDCQNNVMVFCGLSFWMGSDKQQIILANNDADNFTHFFVHDFRMATIISNTQPMQQHNLISKFGNRKINNLHDGFTTILSVATERTSIEHKTFKMGKRVALPFELIIHYSDLNGVVLDIFGGSGSTLIACEKANRKCRIVELEPKFCDIIIKRWEDYTGQRAELIND